MDAGGTTPWKGGGRATQDAKAEGNAWSSCRGRHWDKTPIASLHDIFIQVVYPDKKII